jgi:hypothetical protein
MNRRIPLLFTYRDRVVGMGYTANVSSFGRVLAVEEGGEGNNDIWIYGVEPGALAAHGADPKAALEAFRESFTNVLRDMAAEYHSFADFEAGVHAFFSAVNEPNEAEWQLAVLDVRANKIDLPNVRREPAESARFVQVQEERSGGQGRDFAITGSEIKSTVAA